jgi:hypothetical protein
VLKHNPQQLLAGLERIEPQAIHEFEGLRPTHPGENYSVGGKICFDFDKALLFHGGSI